MKEFPDMLIGRTIERKSEAKDRPDIETILSPLESKESVAREFCVKCGMIAEVNGTFLDENGLSRNDLHDGDYLETDSCPDCPNQPIDDEPREIRIRNIRGLTS
jgi:hypothetical protein